MTPFPVRAWRRGPCRSWRSSWWRTNDLISGWIFTESFQWGHNWSSFSNRYPVNRHRIATHDLDYEVVHLVQYFLSASSSSGTIFVVFFFLNNKILLSWFEPRFIVMQHPPMLEISIHPKFCLGQRSSHGPQRQWSTIAPSEVLRSTQDVSLCCRVPRRIYRRESTSSPGWEWGGQFYWLVTRGGPIFFLKKVTVLLVNQTSKIVNYHFPNWTRELNGRDVK